MPESEQHKQEVTVVQVIRGVKTGFQYLLRNWLLILVAGLLFAVAGFIYASMKKPVYRAEVTFAPETGKSPSLGMYAGIAAQFGLDMLSGGGSVFEGENLIEFLKSSMLIEKALFSKVQVRNQPEVLIDYYARENELYETWKEKPELAVVDFKKDQAGLRARDSLVKEVIKDIRKYLDVHRVDKKVSIISASISSTDEFFAKAFLEQLTLQGIDYYINYRSKKSRENVEILQKQFDSVRAVLAGNISSAAASTDLNVNPIRQIMRANVQNKQIDIQANGQLYGELLKQLELSRIALLKETPFIQIIDTPRLPLEKKRMGRFVTAFFFAVIGGCLVCTILLLRRWYKTVLVKSFTTTNVAVH